MLNPALSPIVAETVRHLQALIRLETVNPPGDELMAAEYLAGVLQAEGLEPLVLKSAPKRGNVIARLKGAGEAPPLLLYSHTDVVPAEPDKWTQPPFAGEIHDGCVWGRGAVDMKGAVAQQLMAMLRLKREAVALRRDVIFAATADEEIGGLNGYGVSWLVRHHPDLLRAEFGLTELGGYSMEFAGQTLYPIQVAEKGVCWVTVRARGRPGHASQPHGDNAVVHIARAVDRLAGRGLGYHLSASARGFLDAAGQAVGGPFGGVLRDMKTADGARRRLEGDLNGHPLKPFLNAILHNTATPTGLSAGVKTNVIPGEAAVTIDGRLLPGFDPERFLGELRGVLGDGFDYEILLTSPPLETRHDTPLFAVMADTVRRHEPGARVVPYLMTAATDAKYLAPLGVPSYGFAPMKMPPGLDFFGLFHNHDERAPIDGLGWGGQVLYDVVQAYCA